MPLVGKKIEITNDQFGSMVRENCLLVDKTLMIEAFLEEQKVSLITRPRRFGKILNMSMLHHFFSATVDGQSTAGLFDRFAIAAVDGGGFLNAHQGQYPVIFITFKDMKELTIEDATDQLRVLIQYVYRQHQDKLESKKLSATHQAQFRKYLDGTVNKAELEGALFYLSECLYTICEK